MKFKFETIKKDYSDFSSDKLLVNAPRTPAFPVRVASEIMARCLSLINRTEELTIYDPCCGGAHLLTVLGFLYNANLKQIYGTDIDENALEYAQENLALLKPNGIQQRKKSLQYHYEKQGEAAQLMALDSAKRLSAMLSNPQQKEIQCFKWDITSFQRPPFKDVNIVITDLPYGNMAHWQGTTKDHPTEQMLNNIYQTLDINNAIVIVICNKKESIQHKNFTQVKRLKHGKRQFFFLRPLFF
ncbi:MAG: N-6 DNA methylase [Tetragenococcus sp.]|nr:N-6 DNA methylase [Tetragenococcus sp.]